jgi:hypothetical protein
MAGREKRGAGDVASWSGAVRASGKARFIKTNERSFLLNGFALAVKSDRAVARAWLILR